MSRVSRHLRRNQRRPSRQTRKGRVSSSLNSTPQKKQVMCVATATKNTNTDTEKPQKKQVVFMATATQNTNTDTEKVTSPEKSIEGNASKGKKGKKTLGTSVSNRVLQSKKTK